jgi:hypothetical protein
MTTTEVHHEEWHGFDITYCHDDSKLPRIRYGCRVEKAGDLAFCLQGTVEDVIDLHFKRPGVRERIQPLALSRARAIIDLRSFDRGQTLERPLDAPRTSDNPQISDPQLRRRLLEVFYDIRRALPRSFNTAKGRVDPDGLCLELDISENQYLSAITYLLEKGWLWRFIERRDNYSQVFITGEGIDAYETNQSGGPEAERPAERPEFSFVTDGDLRSIIERDYAEIPACLAAGAWKAATIMCGTVMEALLLDALLIEQARASQSDQAPKRASDLRRWSLDTMIKVAVDLHILPSDTLGFMSHTVREYRNLIHPAVETRRKITPEREEANAARAAVDLIIKQLS